MCMSKVIVYWKIQSSYLNLNFSEFSHVKGQLFPPLFLKL